MTIFTPAPRLVDLDRSDLETGGAQVDQTAAIALEAQWLAYIRDSGSAVPTAGRNYLGGDVTDAYITPAPGSDLMWIGADWFDSGVGAVDGATDLFTGAALPVRNGAITQINPGTFTGSVQSYAVGSSGVWMDATTQGGLPAQRHWWPIAAIDDNGTMRIMCWRVQTDATTPHGTLLECDLVTLNIFLGYDSHVALGIGAAGADRFWACGMFRDTAHTYIYGMQFVPDFDGRATPGSATPNYVMGDPQNHYSLTRVARVANGSLTTFASWEYWTGAAWVSGITNAAPMVDSTGVPVRGDMGVKKIRDGHYVAVAHRLTDTHLDVYRGETPQGPWTAISRVPLPTQGHEVHDGVTQVGQLCKIIPSSATTGVPAEHSVAMVSRNLITPTGGYSIGGTAWTDINIRRFCPQFVIVPNL